MSRTVIPCSRNNFAVPPVETSSTPMPASSRANSTNPDLSVTLRTALLIFGMRGCDPSLIRVGGQADSGCLGLQQETKLYKEEAKSDLRFGFQPDLAIFGFHRILHRVAAVIFTYLVCLFLHECLERIHAASRSVLAVSCFGSHHGLKKGLYLVMLGINIRKIRDERFVLCRSGSLTAQGLGRSFFFFYAHALDRQNFILRAPVTLFFDL